MRIEKIREKREGILIGEIGALLHDIGKLHPDFIGKNSIENFPKNFDHAKNIDDFLSKDLVDLIKNDKFKFKINEKETDIYSIIKEHHPQQKEDKDKLNEFVKLFISCDHLDSADDKGIVRKKQSKENTIISSPFGFPKEKIDLQYLQKRFEDLQDNLTGLFNNYISNAIDIACFRKALINNLKTTYSHALGETRISANDVTLWDHSHSTASLFKSVLCVIACGEKLEPKKLQWRILGFCWDGIGFIEKGRKIADILQRNSIIEDIKNELKDKFETEIPIGNVIYEDNNGVFFTFPALSNDSKEVARECAEIGLKIIREKSDNELWPFFTLSKPSRTLTTIAEELRFASQKRNMPKISPTLFIEGSFEKIAENPEMPVPEEGEDICPVCRLRTKPVKDERCDICEKRRKGRLTKWLNNREDTIWIDEVADKNNRIALITLNFDLHKWLDGTMVGTIYSQTFEDWRNSNNTNKFFENKQNIQKLKNRGVEINISHKDLSKNCLKIITDEDISQDIGFKSNLINTFFEEIKSSQNQNDENYFENFVNNLKLRLENEPFNSGNLQRLLFTQNPSPARLYRIWKETEEFFDLIIQELKDKIYSRKWRRITFSMNQENIKDDDIDNTILIIKIDGLEPENLSVLHTSNKEFYTIESLEKFKFKEKSGSDAVKEALKDSEIIWIAKEDEPDKNLLNNGTVKAQNIRTEDYYPLIEITKSPLSLRLIVPASDSMKILELMVEMYNKRFEKVLGKLPLNVGLLVSKRKFPLYVLLDAGGRLFNAKEFKQSVNMDVWWDIEGLRNDKYYGFYPIKEVDTQRYTLDDLSSLSKGKSYTLYPGYFDFDLLLGTQDRFNIIYKEKKRIEDYQLFSNRPYYFYQISQMIDLWEILQNNLSSSQISFIEESLMTKLREWRNVNEEMKVDVFRKFAEATVKDAFGSNWEKLRKETQDFILNSTFNNLLFDTIILFKHTIKEDSENG